MAKQITITLPDLPRTRVAVFNAAMLAGAVGVSALLPAIGLPLLASAAVSLCLSRGLATRDQVREAELAHYAQGRADLAREIQARRADAQAHRAHVEAKSREVATAASQRSQSEPERVHGANSVSPGDFAPRSAAVQVAATACALSCVASLPIWYAATQGLL